LGGISVGNLPAMSTTPDTPADQPRERFESFYLREYGRVVKLVYALSGSRLAAEDIAQETFLRALVDWERIQDPAAWVRRVAVRWAWRTTRRRLLEAKALARLLIGQGPAVAELALDDARVWRAVRALPRGQAQVIALYYIVDLPVAEIANTLGLAEGTVKAQLYRGRQALAGRLGDAVRPAAMEDDQ